MPLQCLLLSTINKKGLTLTWELRNFMNITSGNRNIEAKLFKTTHKASTRDFWIGYHYHNKNFYSESGYSTYNGYLILVADSSYIGIPTTKEIMEIWNILSYE